MIGELISFELVVATACPGSPVEVGDVALDGESFVSIFRDFTTYCVESWDTKDYRRICLAERQVGRLPGNVTGIFQRASKHHAQRLGLGKHHELAHIADPAVRRVAIWLVLLVIACPTPPAQLNAMRLGTLRQLGQPELAPIVLFPCPKLQPGQQQTKKAFNSIALWACALLPWAFPHGIENPSGPFKICCHSVGGISKQHSSAKDDQS